MSFKGIHNGSIVDITDDLGVKLLNLDDHFYKNVSTPGFSCVISFAIIIFIPVLCSSPSLLERKLLQF